MKPYRNILFLKMTTPNTNVDSIFKLYRGIPIKINHIVSISYAGYNLPWTKL